MKKNRFIFSVILLAAAVWPTIMVQASSIAPFSQVSNAADFVTLGGGKCVYYNGSGCSAGNWYANPKSNCDWEPCCQLQLTGYQPQDWEYIFSKSCSGSNAQVTIVEYPDKKQCLNPNFDCCCSTPPVAPTIAPATPKTPKFTMPEFQIPIDTVKLSSTTCITDASGNYQCSVPWIGQYVVGLYNYGLSIAGILAAIVLMAGGVLWLISGGDASKVTQAKELIVGSIVGLIILAGSYVLLTQINPNLTIFQPISISAITGKELGLAQISNGSGANSYKNAPCATDAELQNGTAFYATGYYKPAWADTDEFRCVVAMQCTCPNGQDMTKNCDFLYGQTFRNYHPCNTPFPATLTYCNMNANGATPKAGDIAGPGNCLGNLPRNTQVCFKGKTYTIMDTGGGIQGKRIDIWTGSSLDDAYANTGVGILKKGACN